LREVAKSWRGGQNFCVSRFVIACPDLAGEPGVAAGPKPGDHLSTKEFGWGGTPQFRGRKHHVRRLVRMCVDFHRSIKRVRQFLRFLLQ
jgi:hypothetical protein